MYFLGSAFDIIGTHCSWDIEYLSVKYRLSFLSRDFTTVIITAVYISPHTSAKLALKKEYDAIKSADPDGDVIVANETEL